MTKREVLLKAQTDDVVLLLVARDQPVCGVLEGMIKQRILPFNVEDLLGKRH